MTEQTDSEANCLPEFEKKCLCREPSRHIEELEQRSHSHCEDLQNDITQQLKSKERTYIPRDWVQEKLHQIKGASSLAVLTRITPASIKTDGNMVSMEIVAYLDKTTTLEFHFFEDGIIKLNCINPYRPSQFSFELIEKPANLTPYSVEKLITIGTESLEVVMSETQTKLIANFNPFTVQLVSTRSQPEEILLEMNASKSLVFDDNLTADFSFYTEHLYGIPEHTSGLQLQHTQKDLPYRFYNQDVPSYPVGSMSAMYATVPIIMSRNKDSSTLVSMYWQNCSDTYIDIHKKESVSKTFWISERGNLECYFFVSHSYAQHYRSLSHVFGQCAMPQYFSLGYHQCRWSYEDQQDLLQVNDKFNEQDVLCDTITLDIDHTDQCRYFTWNHQLFPDPVAMQNALVADGRQLVTIADPHIKVDPNYSVYREAAQKSLYVKNRDGEPFVGKCWPGESIYLDFLNEETRNFWASQYSYDKYLFSTPHLWAWNDMNEPSVFETKGNHMSLSNLQTIKSLAEPDKAIQVEHREVHNIYGYGQNKATYDGLINRNKDKNIRPHILSRSFYAGSQKWTTVWTGDTAATWAHLKSTVPQLLSLSLCGISNCGGDVGGFIGNPEPELAVRWYQLGAFMPYFRAHSEKTTKRREPWLHDEKEFEIVKETIKERYRLLPYWYSCFEEHCRTAVPLLRPIWFDQTQGLSDETMNEEERFMVGDGLMVAPILEPEKMVLTGVLNGLEGRWYDYNRRKEISKGEEIETGMERIGCFVKGGNIIPTFDIRQGIKSSQGAKKSNIHLIIGLDEQESAKGKLYFDDGETFDYKKGIFSRKMIDFEKKTLTWKEDSAKCGLDSENKVTKAILMGFSGKVESAYLAQEGDRRKAVKVYQSSECVTLEFEAPSSENWTIILN